MNSIDATEISGIRTCGVRQPGQLWVKLYFRAGIRDQQFFEDDLAHLVEHLALSPVVDHPVTLQGTTSLTMTEFEFSGEPKAVQEALSGFCARVRALADGACTGEELERELRVLDHEGGGPGMPPALAEALTQRFGMLGAGRSAVSSGRRDQLDTNDVSRWTRQFFTQSNCAIGFVGPLPDDLSIDLPPGDPAALPIDRSCLSEFPAEFLSEGATTVSWLTPASLGNRAIKESLLFGLIDDRLSRLRQEEGTLYGVAPSSVLVSDGSTVLVLELQCSPEASAQVARAVIDNLHELRAEGVGEEEFERVRASMTRSFAMMTPFDEVDLVVSWHIMGEPGATEFLDQAYEPLTHHDFNELLQGLDDSLLVGLVAGSEVSETESALYPGAQLSPTEGWAMTGTEHPRTLRGRLSGAPRDYLVRVDETGISERINGESYHLRWSDIVGLDLLKGDSDEPMALRFIGNNVWVITVYLSDIKRYQPVLAAAFDHVPKRLQRWYPTEEWM